MKFIYILITISVFQLSACEKPHTPKPKGYFRINFPEKEYESALENYPFSFEIPTYAKLNRDDSPLAEPFWLNLSISKNKSNIHISYKKVENNLAKLTEDSRELVYKHAIKANEINEKLFINNEERVYGTIYELKGNVASPLQFHLTDSVNHFFRASFYIAEIPNYDSLKPVIQFIEEDIYHLIETFSWN